jgi:hypothetical protein
MSTVAAAPPRLNGNSVVPTEVLREADFLQQLLQIRDDVLASKHPRIHLPAKVIEQVAPRLPQTTLSARPTTNGTPASISASQLFPPRPGSSIQTSSTANEFVAPVPPTQRPYSAVSASSSIDPVLLTKSDHLIRAELQLKRQQIERVLKDQFDKKGRGGDGDEREAHLNVEECLIQAQLRVPPVSGIRSTTNNSDGAESFDENSYYSSKADSWSSEELDPKQTTIADPAGQLTSQAKPATSFGAQPRPVQPTVIDLDDEAYEPADDIEIYEPEPALLLDEAEEEDYSPPPADIGANEPSRGRARDRGAQDYGGPTGYDTIAFLFHPFYICFGYCCLFLSKLRIFHTTLSTNVLVRVVNHQGRGASLHTYLRLFWLAQSNHLEQTPDISCNTNFTTDHAAIIVHLALSLHFRTRASVEETRNESRRNGNSKRIRSLHTPQNHILRKSRNRHHLLSRMLNRSPANDAPCNRYPSTPRSSHPSECNQCIIENQNLWYGPIASMMSPRRRLLCECRSAKFSVTSKTSDELRVCSMLGVHTHPEPVGRSSRQNLANCDRRPTYLPIAAKHLSSEKLQSAHQPPQDMFESDHGRLFMNTSLDSSLLCLWPHHPAASWSTSLVTSTMRPLLISGNLLRRRQAEELRLNPTMSEPLPGNQCARLGPSSTMTNPCSECPHPLDDTWRVPDQKLSRRNPIVNENPRVGRLK